MLILGNFICSRIGFGIARQLARDGAKVMISSRKQNKVKHTVSKLETEEQGCTVRGMVCHVAKPEHRKDLIEEVCLAVCLSSMLFGAKKV